MIYQCWEVFRQAKVVIQKEKRNKLDEESFVHYTKGFFSPVAFGEASVVRKNNKSSEDVSDGRDDDSILEKKRSFW